MPESAPHSGVNSYLAQAAKVDKCTYFGDEK